MHLILVGVNHNTAPLAVRERLSFGRAGVGLAARRLMQNEGVRESAILSTCNRTEVYAVCESPDPAPLVHLLAECGVPAEELTPCLAIREDEEAARHLHRVAAGLDSMVLGEAQVLGQVKKALSMAQEAGTAGAVLDHLFRSATTAGKRVRTETGLARGAVSVSHAAVELARRIFGNLRGLQVLILGAGVMSKVAARLLADAGVASILVANRTHERAQALAASLGGRAIRFDDFPAQVAKADVVICSTAAPHPVVRLEQMRPIAAARRGRPLFLIDIALPRDVEPAVGKLEGVFLFTIDDLRSVVEENLAERAAEIEASEAIVSEETARFLAWWRCSEAGPLLAALQRRSEAVVQNELQKVAGRLSHLSERDREVVELLARGVAKRMLREPILAVKRFASAPGPRHPFDVVRELFEIAPPEGDEKGG
ncbi:MAG: glutamyl-tRNA reductase [Armatimonadota bacterium]|nr:glutamyl-tRNA reductase [Armatimonadota bacterium]